MSELYICSDVIINEEGLEITNGIQHELFTNSDRKREK